MKKKTIIEVTVIILLLVIAGVFAIYNTEIYDDILKAKIAGQLEKTYGTSFEVKEMDERRLGIPDTGAYLGFTAYSAEGLFTLGECDWKGQIVSENYIHLNFAPELNYELESIIGNYFEDCYIVEDFFEYGDSVGIDLVTANSIATVEEYKAQLNREKTYFRVYLKDDVTDEELQNALDALNNSGYNGNVYFITVNADLFEELKASGMECYPYHSSVVESLSRIVSIGQAELEELIYNPGQYTRAMYVPKLNTCEIIIQDKVIE